MVPPVVLAVVPEVLVIVPSAPTVVVSVEPLVTDPVRLLFAVFPVVVMMDGSGRGLPVTDIEDERTSLPCSLFTF